MTEITVIRDCDWLVGWNQEAGEHRYLRGADIAFSGDGIVSVGGRYDGLFASERSGRGLLVMPGLVNIHSHPGSEPLRKGITDETRSPGFHHSSLYEFLTVFDNDNEGRKAALNVAVAELLLSGCTTFTDLSVPYEGWLDMLESSGIRCVVAPGFRDARWITRDGHSLEYEWDQATGREGFEAARRVLDRVAQHPSGRLSGMVYPAQIDTCSRELLRDSSDLAKERQLPWQTHAAQSVTEFHEMQRRHGRTPIAWLDEIGALGEYSILGHGIFLDHHPWLHWTTREDFEILRKRGASIAHCPTVFARRGIALRTLGGYLREGINVGIGTDTYPHNMLEEMRTAMMTARIVAESVADLYTSDVFNAATLGGARALKRDDIGRLAPGCKSDLVLIDLSEASMRPVREPLRSLMYVACERAVKDVYVDAELVVSDGCIQTIDLEDALDALTEAQQRSLERTRGLDWAGRSAEQLSPMVFGIDATDSNP